MKAKRIEQIAEEHADGLVGRELSFYTVTQAIERAIRKALKEEKRAIALLTAEPEPCEDARYAIERQVRAEFARQATDTIPKLMDALDGWIRAGWSTEHIATDLLAFWLPDRSFHRLQEMQEENERLRKALFKIRDRDWVENALNPQWPAAIACEALSTHPDKGEEALAATEQPHA